MPRGILAPVVARRDAAANALQVTWIAKPSSSTGWDVEIAGSTSPAVVATPRSSRDGPCQPTTPVGGRADAAPASIAITTSGFHTTG